MKDLSLGFTIARLYEGGTNGPILCNLLRGDILLEALRNDDRWLAHWAFSMLHQREVALRCLCVSSLNG